MPKMSLATTKWKKTPSPSHRPAMVWWLASINLRFRMHFLKNKSWTSRGYGGISRNRAYTLFFLSRCILRPRDEAGHHHRVCASVRGQEFCGSHGIAYRPIKLHTLALHRICRWDSPECAIPPPDTPIDAVARSGCRHIPAVARALRQAQHLQRLHDQQARHDEAKYHDLVEVWVHIVFFLSRQQLRYPRSESGPPRGSWVGGGGWQGSVCMCAHPFLCDAAIFLVFPVVV